MEQQEKQEQHQLTVSDIIVRSSIQVFLADRDNPKPEGFGSGFVMEHRERFFLVSVRHVTDDPNLATFLETNLPSENVSTPIQPLGGFCYFDLFTVGHTSEIKEFEDLLKNGKKLDITFAEIKGNIELIQPEIDFTSFKIEAGYKMILDSRDTALPHQNKTYAFFGKIKHDYDGIYLKMEHAFKHGLKFHRTDKHFHIFLAREIIRDENEYKGCSGAPIIDSDGLLVAVACLVRVPSKMVYGFSIQECIKLLDIAIDTGMLEDNTVDDDKSS
ncbi:MAG: hypothetical protein HYU71_15750 [Bacteroidetes bacterium]|nr:hypothetical protein [Bacteroidota bacterium]